MEGVGFISFCIELFDELAARGWPRVEGPGETHISAESFPTSAWRGLKLPPLPGKAATSAEQIAAHANVLREPCGVVIESTPPHDEHFRRLSPDLVGSRISKAAMATR